MRGNLKLPGQFVDTNFAHIDSNALLTRRLTDFLRVLYGIKFALVIWRIGMPHMAKLF